MIISAIIIIVFVVIALLAYCLVVFFMLRRIKEKRNELSYKEGVYTGPAGEPLWNGTLPQKADNYVTPRYVYENMVESTEFLPENGRIIGYRISPTLVIHSRIIDQVNPPTLTAYMARLGGKLLEVPDAVCLQKNWEAVSALREKSGDASLKAQWFWATKNGVAVAIHYKDDLCADAGGYSRVWHTLILKR